MIYAYQRRDPEHNGDAWLEELLEKQGSAEEREDEKLYCFICGRIITSTSSRIAVEGAHEHTFTNPGGYRFRIGCFREAPGCEQAGEFIQAYSWFDGYAWRYATCRSCRMHLGWIYRSRDSFFGLVVDRLLSSRDSLPSDS